MAIYAKRYQWQVADPVDSMELLDNFVGHPEFVTYPYPPDVLRRIGAHILTDPGNLIWTSHCDNQLTGLVLLQRVIPNVDALFHFLFLDHDLVGKRKLLHNLLGICFSEFGFHRLSMEVPEGVRIDRFARKVLGFRFEGEYRPRNPELPAALTDNWVAKQGSRREQAHYDGSVWRDVLLLRLLASEWVGDSGEGEATQCRSEPSQAHSPPLPEPPLAA